MESVEVNGNGIINSEQEWENGKNFNLNCGTSGSQSRKIDNSPSRQPLHFVKKHRTNLPIEAVKVLKQWLFQHRFQPYPNDLEKSVLAEETQLSNMQVCNWFVNARRRILPDMLRNDGMNHEQVIIRRRGRRIKSRSPNGSNESLESNDETFNEAVESPASTDENQLELVETCCEIDGTCDYPECLEMTPEELNQESTSSGDSSSSCLQLLIEAAMVVHRNDESQARNQ